MDELLSVAPMMEVTDRHFRRLLRFLTKKTILYTEMVVDETIIHNPNLDMFIGRSIEENPSIIQLGGHDPELLARAAEICQVYSGDSYGEINLNCGCPSQRVSKRCFGAKLMLEPDLVRQLVYEMGRRVSVPISVKCRIGVDEQDSYDELKNFISTVHQGGVNKFIIHSRKCLLKLNPKQNRDIPPLQYEVVHNLINDFPDLKFILNGGIQNLDQAKDHILPPEDASYGTSSVHGVMIGRAAWNNPIILANADTKIFGEKSDPCFSRREILEKYMDYCDIMSSEEPSLMRPVTMMQPSSQIMLNAMRNLAAGLKGNSKFRIALNDLYVEQVKPPKRNRFPNVREIIEGAMQQLQNEDLDEQLGTSIVEQQ